MVFGLFGVGGWLNVDDAQNYLAYGQVYGTAVKTLIAHFKKPTEKLLEEADASGHPDVSLLPAHALGILPLVYNFRHYVELKLKGLILMKGGKIKNTHNLSELLNKLIEVSGTTRISDETKSVIDRLQKSDNGPADAYRYPYDRDGKRHFKENSEFLQTVNNFEKFESDVSTVMRDLENVEGDFDAERNAEFD